jgi:antitoxin VapB
METTIFMNGQSQAIRIPKEFRLHGKVCEILKRGKELIIREKTSTNWREFFENYRCCEDFSIEGVRSGVRSIDL